MDISVSSENGFLPEIRRLLGKFTEMPVDIKLFHLLTLIIRDEDKGEFRNILGSLPVELVRKKLKSFYTRSHTKSRKKCWRASESNSLKLHTHMSFQVSNRNVHGMGSLLEIAVKQRETKGRLDFVKILVEFG